MAKNANVKAWTLSVGELAKRWSDQPFDLTAPSAPVIAAFGSPTTTSVTVQVTTPSVDARSGIFGYQVEVSQAIGGPYTLSSIIGVAEATAGHVLNGLSPGSTYFVRLRGIDNAAAHNVSLPSNVVEQVTSAAPPAPDVWWDNWPFANICLTQGSSNGHILDPNAHQAISEHNMFVFQGFNLLTPSRVATRVTNVNLIRAKNLNGRRTRIVLYISVNQAHKVESDSHTSLILALINHATKGNTNWWLRRVAPSNAQIEAVFNPTLFWCCNISRNTLVNSLTQSFQTALMKEYKALLDASDTAHDLLALLDGFFVDDSHFRLTGLTTGNGATSVSDPDMNEDGVAEVANSYAAGVTGGSRLWCEGQIDLKNVIKAEFGTDFMYFPNGSELGTYPYDGRGALPFPLSAIPVFNQLEMNLQEQVPRFGLGFGSVPTGNALWQWSGGGGLLNFSRRVHIARACLMADSACTGGRGWVVLHFSGADRTPNQNDYEMCRFVAGLAMVQEKCAVAVNRAGTVPISLDECKIKLGNPIGARTLGTINDSTAAYTYTQRTANFSSGVARFYWSEYQEGLVIVRGDSPPVGAWPDTGAAINCTLPSPGTGKKWQRYNAANYTNPDTLLSMNNQSPLVNSGADVGATVSMRPFTALFLRRVNA